MPYETSNLKTVIRTLILGYEVQIIQGKSLDKIKSEIEKVMEPLLR